MSDQPAILLTHINGVPVALNPGESVTVERGAGGKTTTVTYDDLVVKQEGDGDYIDRVWNAVKIIAAVGAAVTTLYYLIPFIARLQS